MNEIKYSSAVVHIKPSPNSNYVPYGLISFKDLPRVSDFINLELQGEFCIYKVVAVIHPMDTTEPCKIFAHYEGKTNDVIQNLT
ncbi:MAG TPA: hypothetical protein VK184_26045 [Nostocaceae cyanobacterium]|nr:hypothetical protein [Nostocaceae cyanobacterium]